MALPDSSSSLLSSFFLLFYSTYTSLLLLPFASSYAQPHKGFIAKLIHRDSIFSPSYNLNHTIEDRAARMVQNSNARYAYISQKTLASSGHSYRPGLIADGIFQVFLVSFSIGLPPVCYLAIMDTSSSLTWIQCLPCKACYKQKSQIFDPSRSSTYAKLPCASRSCDYIDSHLFCDNHSTCIYEQFYIDGSSSAGNMAREQLTFETSNQGLAVLSNVLFGCGHENAEAGGSRTWTGVFGLGSSPISVIAKLGNKFSYCIGNISDPLYNFNRLALGDTVNLQGFSTPFQIHNSHYYVNLEDISVGQARLDIDPTIFKRQPYSGGVIIDSGTEFTHLPELVYNRIVSRINRMVDGVLKRHKDERYPWVLCYYGDVRNDLQGLPTVTFHLEEGVDIVVDAGSLFYQADTETFCITMRPLASDDMLAVSVIGVIAQQYYNVAYDIGNRRIFFRRTDCKLLNT
ncbi:Aspartic proteinase CDR1 [Linum perenne]